jgi:crossover junction endodeoxyribonuclease RuvC
MLVLGIDPGLCRTGYGLLSRRGRKIALVEAGVIRSDDEQPLEQRLLELHRGVAEVIAEFRPDAMAVEQLFSAYEHPRTAILMGHARGTVFLAAAQAGVPVTSYTPARIKKNLTGDGRADKERMQRAVAETLRLTAPLEPPDVADAIAAALCHLHFAKPLDLAAGFGI